MKCVNKSLGKPLTKSLTKSVISTIILSVVIGTGAAFAQAPAVPPAPATTAAPATAAAPPAATALPAPAATKTAKPKLNPDEKKKVSLACSVQANDKQLHGKERRTFRAACIKHGGTMA
jgi:hypothetical protein